MESSSKLIEPSIMQCPDYGKLGLWMSKTFPHHFKTKEVFFINQILQVKSLDDVETFLTLQPRDLITKLGRKTYLQWLPTIVNCMTYWTILVGIQTSMSYTDFIEQREALHEMVSQIFSPDNSPKYSSVSPLAQQYDVTSPTFRPQSPQVTDYVPTNPKMVDSHGQAFSSTNSIQGGVNDKKDSKSLANDKGSHHSHYSYRWWDGNESVDSFNSYSHKPGGRMKRGEASKSVGHSSHSKSRNPDSDRHFRSLPAKVRTKFDKISWDGMHTTFRPFRRAVEGHLLQVGAGYLASNNFVEAYKILGEEYLKTDKFWNTYKISYPQALYDMRYLYGILVTATKDMQHKIILKFESSQDGILAWNELKKDFAHDGSEDLKIEQLEAQVHQPYSSCEPGGMAGYIDKFQAYVAELETMIPKDYTEARKKRLLLTNIREAEGVAHLIQKCRDDPKMGYEATAAYLRKNAVLVDYANQSKPPRKLMTSTKEATPSNDEDWMNVDKVSSLFHSMASEGGLKLLTRSLIQRHSEKA